MRFILVCVFAYGLAPALALAAPRADVGCYDNLHTVEMSARLSKEGGASDVRIMINGKNRLTTKEGVSRVRNNPSDFFLVFTVQMVDGPEEFELDTHYPGTGERKTSSGFLTNKTQKSARLPVTCHFYSN